MGMLRKIILRLRNSCMIKEASGYLAMVVPPIKIRSFELLSKMNIRLRRYLTQALTVYKRLLSIAETVFLCLYFDQISPQAPSFPKINMTINNSTPWLPTGQTNQKPNISSSVCLDAAA